MTTSWWLSLAVFGALDDGDNLGPDLGPVMPKHHGKSAGVRYQKTKPANTIDNLTKSAKPPPPVQIRAAPPQIPRNTASLDPRWHNPRVPKCSQIGLEETPRATLLRPQIDDALTLVRFAVCKRWEVLRTSSHRAETETLRESSIRSSPKRATREIGKPEGWSQPT